MKSEGNKSRFRMLNVMIAELKESFLMAMGALAAHKLRSALTLLGVMVGVFSIIVVMTAMQAMQKRISTDLNQLGGETFVVAKWPGVFFGGPEDAEKYWRRKELTLEQGKAVINRATLALSVGLDTDFQGGEMSSRYKEASPGVSLNGDTPGSFVAQNWVIQEGRLLADSDVDGAHDVCVLGSVLATNLFPFGSALNEKIKFNGINYTVIGVLEANGSMAGGNQDNFAVIPITTGLNRYGARRQSISIMVRARSQANYDDTVEQVRSILRAVRKVPPGKEDDFEIFSNDSVLSQIDSFTFAVRLGVALVSSIALVAAGIGIMNIMLVSVTERTREIGVRRAIGAKKRNIMVQFIMEAVVLCELGGLIGVLMGSIGGNVAAHYMNMPSVIPWGWAAIGLFICSVIGIVFGTYPAYKAANLDPIESLRYE
ncbi:MAG: transporter efflux protein [Pedosphaera sp.]|nr:transporter efflux protein [Pedosphaera sp.]